MSKPCLAFRILGAGSRCTSAQDIQTAFRKAYSSIKPGDTVIVGMFPKGKDQVSKNADFVRTLI